MTGPSPVACSRCWGTGSIQSPEGTAWCPCENDHRTVTFETDGQKDGMDRYHFSMRWWDDDFHLGARWRGQHFHAQIEPYIAKAKSEGRMVVVRPKRQ